VDVLDDLSQMEIDEIALDREIASRSMLGWFRIAWEHVDTSPLVLNWHHGLTCEVLEAVSAGQIRDLVVNQPPGTSKSLTFSVLWPVWEWLHVDPKLRYIFGSYSDDLTRRDAGKARALIESDWFRARWPELDLKRGGRSTRRLENAAGGVRFSTSVKGGSTGRHAHRIVVDDPTKPLDAHGSRAALGTELETARTWWDQTLSTRQADPRMTARVLVMQRLHRKDLSQKVLDETEGVVHVCLPMEHEAKTHCIVRWPVVAKDGSVNTRELEDPRMEEGELLDPVRYPAAEVERMKVRLGTVGYAGQAQQRPQVAGGTVLKKEWFRYWGVPGSKYPSLPDDRREIQIWDMTFKGQPTGGQKRSFVCGQVWAQVGGDFLLVGQERGQWGLTEQLAAFKRLTGAHPRAHRKYIEDAANGAAVENLLRDQIPGIKLISTGGGSESRAEAASIHLESGNVYFPHPSIATFPMAAFERELEDFPMGAHDDQVDCFSHAVVQMAQGVHHAYAKAMQAMTTQRRGVT